MICVSTPVRPQSKDERSATPASNAGASQGVDHRGSDGAAIGADMPVTEPIGSMVVDIGGGRPRWRCSRFAASLTDLGAGRRHKMDERSPPMSGATTIC